MNISKAVLIALTVILALSAVPIAAANTLPDVDLVSPRGSIDSSSPSFTWNGEDPDGDRIDYKFYLQRGDGNPFTGADIVREYNNKQSGEFSTGSIDLDSDTTYSWGVKADDGQGIGNSRSDVWTFTTTDTTDNELPTIDIEELGNNEPVDPEFRWTGEDSDGDELDYTLYIERGSGNPFVGEDFRFDYVNRDPGDTVSVSPVRLDPGTEYTWGVKADDGQGIGKARSSTDTFETEDEGDENQAPNAEFTKSTDGLTVEVDASASSDGDGNIDEYEWKWTEDDDFDEGDETESHTYGSEGTYEITLRVTDDDDASDTRTRTVTVSRPEDDDDDFDTGHCEVVPGFMEVEPGTIQRGEDAEAKIVVFNQGDSQRVRTIFRTDYGERKTREKTIPGNGQRTFSARFSPEEDTEISSHVSTVDDGPCGESKLGIQTQAVDVYSRDTEEGNLEVIVEDKDGDYIRNARVDLENGNREVDFTNSNGRAFFDLDSGQQEVTVSKSGYSTETRSKYISEGGDETLTFVLDSDDDDESDDDDDTTEEDATLEVDVEDEDDDPIEDATVEVINGDGDIKETDDEGEASFTLDPDEYDIVVSKSGYQPRSREVDLDEGEDERISFTLRRTDDGFDDEGVQIEDVNYPDSVCRGNNLVVEVEVSKTGDRFETVRLTGSGLGSSVSTASFTLEEDETRTRNVRFRDVEGSGSERFTIIATNHNSDRTSRTVDVDDCFGEDTDDATGISMEVSPDRARVGESVKVSGFLDGTNSRTEVTIRVNGDRVKRVDSQPDGYYQTFITTERVGDLTVTASTGEVSKSRTLESLPTTNVVHADSPDTVVEGEEFEICADVNSQITPRVDLVRDGRVIDSKNAKEEVCFEITASDTGTHTYRVDAVARGYRSSATTEVEIIEDDSEAKSFPDQIASVESGDGIVKATIYNNNDEKKTYDVTLFGVPDSWTSQTDREVILMPGERQEVFFYITPQSEGVFNTEIQIDSEGETVYRQQVQINSGGTATDLEKSLIQHLLERLGA